MRPFTEYSGLPLTVVSRRRSGYCLKHVSRTLAGNQWQCRPCNKIMIPSSSLPSGPRETKLPGKFSCPFSGKLIVIIFPRSKLDFHKNASTWAGNGAATHRSWPELATPTQKAWFSYAADKTTTSPPAATDNVWRSVPVGLRRTYYGSPTNSNYRRIGAIFNHSICNHGSYQFYPLVVIVLVTEFVT